MINSFKTKYLIVGLGKQQTYLNLQSKLESILARTDTAKNKNSRTTIKTTDNLNSVGLTKASFKLMV